MLAGVFVIMGIVIAMIVMVIFNSIMSFITGTKKEGIHGY